MQSFLNIIKIHFLVIILNDDIAGMKNFPSCKLLIKNEVLRCRTYYSNEISLVH